MHFLLDHFAECFSASSYDLQNDPQSPKMIRTMIPHPPEMSELLNNGLPSGFRLPVLMILVMVQIIITGFEDFGSGSNFWFFQFTVLKNWTNFRFFFVKKNCLVKKFFI